MLGVVRRDSDVDTFPHVGDDVGPWVRHRVGGDGRSYSGNRRRGGGVRGRNRGGSIERKGEVSWWCWGCRM